MAESRSSQASADVVRGYRAVHDDAAVVALERDVVSVSGPEAATFLQGQLSQDVAGMAPGGSAWALLLQPQGKMVALVRVTRQDDDAFVVDTDAGWGSAVVERLTRYLLRVKCRVEPLDWRCIGVRGPRSHEVAAAGSGLVVIADWPPMAGVDLLGEAPVPPAGVATCPPAGWAAARIEVGLPAMGAEIDERTIPAEAGVVELAVSFTKGCYTGQELVARIDSRGGNVPRRLRGVVVSSGVLPPPGADLIHDGRQVGHLTSVAWSPGREAPVALAYLGRAVSPPADVEVSWEGGSVPARVEALPLA